MVKTLKVRNLNLKVKKKTVKLNGTASSHNGKLTNLVRNYTTHESTRHTIFFVYD